MKVKDGFAKRLIAGSYIVVPVGAAAKETNMMITLNETGSFLWDCLRKDTTEDALVAALLGEYDVDEARAKEDVQRFVALLSEHHILA